MGPLSGASHINVGYASSLSGDTLRCKEYIRSHNLTERKERKAEYQKDKEERLRRLKNARREEMEGRLCKVRYVLDESDEAAYAADGERGGGVSAIDETALMKLMEGEYDPEKFEKIMGGAYGIEYYGEEERQWKTDGREAVRGGGDYDDPISVETVYVFRSVKRSP